MLTLMKTTGLCSIAAVFFCGSAAIAHPHYNGTEENHDHDSGWVHENGIGADPDRDTNPATDTGGISLRGGAAEAGDDPPYAVVTFEPPPGKHGQKIGDTYKKDYGITFGPGLTLQICQGQRRFQYDTMCTYEAAPSGAFAAGYYDFLNRPLTVEFNRPACVVTFAIYPTGGKEGEEFELTIKAVSETGKTLPNVVIPFQWTNETVRWRHMAGAYYLGDHARKISISMKSKDPKESKEILRYLIDDFAYIETGCEEALGILMDRAEGQTEKAKTAIADSGSDGGAAE